MAGYLLPRFYKIVLIPFRITSTIEFIVQGNSMLCTNNDWNNHRYLSKN